jgi:hypothetical protein
MKLATKVYSSETIELQDGREVTLKPLAIGRLRKFMAAWQEFANIEKEEDAFNIYVNCCGIALSKELSDDFPVTEGEKEEDVLNDSYREYLEDVLDMDTIYKILDVCGGLKLNDPKLLAEVERVTAEAAGTS